MTGPLSVIVPVHNCEKWLPACLESLIRQTYKDLDLLLVDDGSTDASLAICKAYAERDPRVRVFSKANGGVSSARNEGLRHAAGEWLTFVDADDWLDADMLETVCRAVDTEHDFYIWDMTRSDGAMAAAPQYIRQISMEEMCCAVIAGRRGRGYRLGAMVRAGWAKLYRTGLIRDAGLLFDEDLYIGEDAVFILKYLQALKDSRRIKALPACGYHYRILDTSSSHRYKGDLLEQSCLQLQHIERLLRESGMLPGIKLNTALTCLCWHMFNSLITNELKREKQADTPAGYDDARCWLERYKMQMRSRRVEPWQLPRFTLLMWSCAGLLSDEGICRISALHIEQKLRRSKKEKGKCARSPS